MLNQAQKIAINAHLLIHSFLYEFPVVCNEGPDFLSFQRKPKALIGCLVSIVMAFVLCLACLYDLGSWYTMERPNYNIGIASIHTMGAILLLLMLSIVLVLVRNSECLSAINELLREQQVSGNYQIHSVL